MDSPALFHPDSVQPPPGPFWSEIERVCREIRELACSGLEPERLDDELDKSPWSLDLILAEGNALSADLNEYLTSDPRKCADGLLEAAVNRSKAVHWVNSSWWAGVSDFSELGALAEVARYIRKRWEPATIWPIEHASAFVVAAWGRIRWMLAHGVLDDAPDEPEVVDWRGARNALAKLIAFTNLRNEKSSYSLVSAVPDRDGRWDLRVRDPIDDPTFGPFEMRPVGPALCGGKALEPGEKAVYDKLYRKAFTLSELATALKVDRSNLHRRVLKPLMDRGFIRNEKGEGYYRPDAPPPEWNLVDGVVSW
jgi:hypothetical protein